MEQWGTSPETGIGKMPQEVQLNTAPLCHSNSHFGIQPENSPPLAGCFQASKPRVRACRERTLGFEAHTENCCLCH